MTAQDLINRKHRTTMRVDAKNRHVVTLYWTDIVTFDRDHIILNTGGWATATTKARMNFVSRVYYLGYQVGSRNGRWQVTFQGHLHDFSTDAVRLDRKTGAVTALHDKLAERK